MKKIVLKGFCLLLMLSPLLSLCMLAQFQPTTWGSIDNKGEAWVKNISRPYTVSHGLEGRHLALWASHGRFYDIGKGDFL